MLETCSPFASIARAERTATETQAAARITLRVELLPLLGRLLLGVVEPRQGEALGTADPLEVDQHPRGEQRPGQRAPPGLVHARHEAAAEGAVEAEQAGGGPPLAALPGAS